MTGHDLKSRRTAEGLEKALSRFADAAIGERDDLAAHLAFADAQAVMPRPHEARAEALVWVQAEQRLVQLLPATVEALTDAEAALALDRLRPKGSQR